MKAKLLNWVDNFEPPEGKPNISPGLKRGRDWIRKMVRDKKIYVCKADKGGATLIINYEVVIKTIETDLHNPANFEEQAEDMVPKTVQKIKELVNGLVKEEKLSLADRTLITGLNVKGNMKHNPEYRAQTPTVYPLYKIHSMTTEEIKDKKIPKHRLVSSVKFGPLYRLEKWLSPHLTELSQEYCKDEFLLDTSDFLQNVNNFNQNISNQNNCKYSTSNNLFLFTIDVKALYPSINSSLVLLALEDALAQSELPSLDENLTGALQQMTAFVFNNSFVNYQEKSYKSIKGIPTGGSISRQSADLFLYWMFNRAPNYLRSGISMFSLILFWKRFIDDIFGVWKGTVRQFHVFIKELNKMAAPFGIEFDKFKIGKEVEFLDSWCYLEGNKIEHRLYKKPIDPRRFLQRDSFHPPHVFKSVATSQMQRMCKLNSKEETLLEDLDSLVTDFHKSGYNLGELHTIRDKLLEERSQRTPTEALEETPVPLEGSFRPVIFPVQYFDELKDFKALVRTLEADLDILMGHHNIVFAAKRGLTIRNTVMNNRALCIPEKDYDHQKCMGKGCKTCPQMLNMSEIEINNVKVKLPKNVSCKTKNVVYIHLCNCCNSENCYGGQTSNKFAERNNGHRGKFNLENYELSALSNHSYIDHNLNIGLKDFSCAIVKKCNFMNLDREEFKLVENLRLQTLGLNRCKITK